IAEPLADALLVEHALVFSAAEPLLASLGDPVPARVGRVDLVDDPDLARTIDAELVLRVDEDEAALARPILPGGEERQRVPGQLVPLLLRQEPAPNQLARRDRFVVLSRFFLRAGRQDRR